MKTDNFPAEWSSTLLKGMSSDREQVQMAKQASPFTTLLGNFRI